MGDRRSPARWRRLAPQCACDHSATCRRRRPRGRSPRRAAARRRRRHPYRRCRPCRCRWPVGLHPGRPAARRRPGRPRGGGSHPRGRFGRCRCPDAWRRARHPCGDRRRRPSRHPRRASCSPRGRSQAAERCAARQRGLSGSRRRDRADRGPGGSDRARPGERLTATVPERADRVRIYEVGPRDGLQNEAIPIPTETKLRFIELLAAAGLTEIEATSFVAPAAIPQLADADALMAALPRAPGVRYPVLVPNLRGLARAEAAAADAIAVFTAASDAFTQRNIGMSVDASLEAFGPVLDRAGRLGWWRRGYVSTAFGCPYTGAVDPDRAVDVGLRLLRLGVDEVCFGDTIGVAVPSQVNDFIP